MSNPTSNTGKFLIGQVEANLAAASAKDLVKMGEMYADDIVYQCTGGHFLSGEYQGRQRILDLLARVFASFKDGPTYTVDRCIAVDNTVVVTFTGVGTTVNGADYHNDYCAIWDFNDEQKVVRVTEYYDSHHLVNVLPRIAEQATQ